MSKLLFSIHYKGLLIIGCYYMHIRAIRATEKLKHFPFSFLFLSAPGLTLVANQKKRKKKEVHDISKIVDLVVCTLSLVLKKSSEECFDRKQLRVAITCAIKEITHYSFRLKIIFELLIFLPTK